LRELRDLLRLGSADVVSLDELGVAGEPVEDGLTFETNAKIKARFAARATGSPALADDSGIEVDALGGGPGVRTRRYAGRNATDAENNAKLLRELDGAPLGARGARYVCVLALALPDAGAPGGLRLVTRRGTTRGRIALKPRGSGGFGYDPLFEPAGERPGGRTFAQYRRAEKDAISHRGRAARRMEPVLRGLGFD
jgi:XTP/dITP diphosphohydrolase